MDLEWKKMIETNIFEYISKVDYNHPDFSIKEFKNNLQNIIGMQPAVKIKWNTTEKINELKRAAGANDYKEIIEEAKTIDVTFIDSERNPITLQFLL